MEEPRSKRAKVEEGSVGKEEQSGLSRDDIARQSLSGQFFQDLEKHRMDYSASEPYLHCVVEDLFDRDFLLNVQKEIVSHLHFKEKVTDIYQVSPHCPGHNQRPRSLRSLSIGTSNR